MRAVQCHQRRLARRLGARVAVASRDLGIERRIGGDGVGRPAGVIGIDRAGVNEPPHALPEGQLSERAHLLRLGLCQVVDHFDAR